MDTTLMEISIKNDQYKLDMLTIEQETFQNIIGYQNNIILTESVADAFKKLVGIIKEKLILIKDKFLDAIDFIKGKIKDFLKRFKKESFTLLTGKFKINPNEKINVSKNNVYDIDKLISKIDKFYNNKYKKNIKIAVDSCTKIVSFLNSGNFQSVFVEINATKDKLPIYNADREKFADGNTTVDISSLKIEKDTMTGAEFIDYCKKLNILSDKVDKYTDDILNINKDILSPSIKAIDKLLVKDPNKIKSMNLQELKFNKGLNEWILCINRWANFGISYGEIITRMSAPALADSFKLLDRVKSLRIDRTDNSKGLLLL